jgi:DNA-binding transcriptional regulator GbsR (MarR family)
VPGGRLTHQDRQYIARAVAEGVAYAEMARRLGRPTSTISREVARNGGLDGYRPDRAQHATQVRARRHKPASAPALHPGTQRYRRDPEAVRDFEQRFIAMATETGFPRMVAKVLVCLFTSDSGGLTAGEMTQRLQVSPASISKAVHMLEQLEFIGRERVPGTRRERYVIDEDVWYRAWSRRAETFAMYADMANEGARVFGIDTPAGARLDEMGQFFGLVRRDILEVTEHWRQYFSARRQRHGQPDRHPDDPE